VTRGWKKLHSEELRVSCPSPNVISVRLAGYVACISTHYDIAYAVEVSTAKSEGRSLLGRTRCRWRTLGAGLHSSGSGWGQWRKLSFGFCRM
jgi:hypothetical protein